MAVNIVFGGCEGIISLGHWILMCKLSLFLKDNVLWKYTFSRISRARFMWVPFRCSVTVEYWILNWDEMRQHHGAPKTPALNWEGLSEEGWNVLHSASSVIHFVLTVYRMSWSSTDILLEKVVTVCKMFFAIDKVKLFQEHSDRLSRVQCRYWMSLYTRTNTPNLNVCLSLVFLLFGICDLR